MGLVFQVPGNHPVEAKAAIFGAQLARSFHRSGPLQRLDQNHESSALLKPVLDRQGYAC